MERKDNDTRTGHLFTDKIFVGILLINSLDLYVSRTYSVLVTLPGPGNTNETKEDTMPGKIHIKSTQIRMKLQTEVKIITYHRVSNEK